MAISQVRPVPDIYPISGEYLQDWGFWTPDRIHFGVDFDCPTGTRVRSVTQKARVHAIHRPNDGWGDGSFGICVVMDVLDTEWYYIYAHLSSTEVALNQIVEAGDFIARSGATGYVTGPHLHVQVCTSPDFPRDATLMGDPILGLRNQQPTTPEVPTDITVESVHSWLTSLNKVVGDDRTEGKARDELLKADIAEVKRTNMLILNALDALVEALPKG
jgi:hypothetical protein